MASFKTYGSEICGIVNVLPTGVEDNLQFSLVPVEERNALVEHTGIRFRRVLENREFGVEALFQAAIRNLLAQQNWEANTIDVLICVTQTPKKSIPSVACQLHDAFDFSTDVICYDINSGCSGFVYGLHTVQSILSSLAKENGRAILCCGDVSTHVLESSDRTARPVFSDAVSAVAIQKTADQHTTSYFNLQTAGSGKAAIQMETALDGADYMRLNGIDIFNYSIKYVPKNVTDLLQFAGKTSDFPSVFVFHQANKLINESIRKRLQISVEKTPYTLYEFGNTASASIPITLVDWLKKNTTEEQHSAVRWLLIAGFGVGFSMASGIVPLSNSCAFETVEIDENDLIPIL